MSDGLSIYRIYPPHCVNLCLTKKMLGIFCILVTCLFFVRGQEADPCLPTTYEALDHPWRSTSNILSTLDTAQCDSTVIKKWYRSTSGAGGTIPTTVPDLQACGTGSPIWMDDALPNAGETAEVKMCVRTIFSACQSSWNIRVKNCDTFYVYELEQAQTCPSAYCFGDKSPCPEDQTSDTGFMPCSEISVNTSGINLSPNVTADLVETEKSFDFGTFKAKVIQFQCNIDVPSDLTTWLFDVKWLINDNLVETFSNVPYSSYQDSGLQETSWIGTFRMGFLVKCGVRFRPTAGSDPGSYTYSEPFYAGIQTDSSEYVVSETGTIDITVRPTVPVGCMYPPGPPSDQYEENHCNLRLSVRTPGYYNDGQLKCTPGGVTDEPISFSGTHYCGLTFSFLERNVAKKITIFGSGDNFVNLNSRSIFIRMAAEALLTHDAWTSATSPDIHIVVEDQDIDLEGKFCVARTDPNMYTFDNRFWLYHQSGEHVLYRHNVLPIRVHTVFDSCVWGGSCVCGVAVRNGDALFVVNLCRSAVGAPYTSSTTNTNQYVEQRACDNTHMTVEKKGSVYTVTLSSGTVVIISVKIDSNIQYTYVRYVMVKPSLADWKASTGLCGLLDGNPDNDMQYRDGSLATSSNEFGSNWRLDPATDGSSLFDVNIPLSDYPITPLQYCKCRTNETIWSSISDQVLCNLDSSITSCAKVTDTSGYFTQCDKARVRRKKDTYPDTNAEPTKFGVTLDPNYIVNPDVYEWRNDWSEPLAREACRRAFNGNALLSKCKDIVPKISDNVNASEEECMNDIKVSGNANFIKDTVEALKTSCIVEAMRSENLTKRSGDESGMTFLEELLQLSCPNNCSGNGNCINGTCACNSGLYGDECSLRKTDPPVVRQVGTNGLCRSDVTSCRSFVIPGFNFIDSELTCQVRYIKVYADRWEIQSLTESFPATYLNSLTCICTIPSTQRTKRSDQSESVFAEGFLLSISNDGVSFSNETTFITYDSACYECNSTSVSCTQLNSCSASSTRSGTNTNKDDTADTQVLSLSVGIGMSCLIILSVLITIMCFKYKKQRSHVGDSSTDVRQGPNRERFAVSYHRDEWYGSDARKSQNFVKENDIILEDFRPHDELPGKGFR